MDYQEWQKAVSDYADRLLAQEVAAGQCFSEALANWAIDKATREIEQPVLH